MATKRDLHVLDMIFDPESQTYQDTSISASHIADIREKPIDLPNPESISELKQMENEAVELMEKSSQPLKPIEILTEVINRSGNLYASGFNNRAQCYRIINDNVNASSDLDNAISLATGQLVNIVSSDLSPEEKESQIHSLKTVLAQAHTQRAVLKRDTAADPEDPNIQENIRMDFEKGAHYGNDIARRMAVVMNPVAKLCGNMVEQMLRTEKLGGSYFS